jgi:hypothetical protein
MQLSCPNRMNWAGNLKRGLKPRDYVLALGVFANLVVAGFSPRSMLVPVVGIPGRLTE